jgi:hypothetical protein
MIDFTSGDLFKCEADALLTFPTEPTERHWREMSRLEDIDIEAGLANLALVAMITRGNGRKRASALLPFRRRAASQAAWTGARCAPHRASVGTTGWGWRARARVRAVWRACRRYSGLAAGPTCP